MVDDKGVVQTDYGKYGSWAVQVFTWTDPKTWVIVEEYDLPLCSGAGNENQYCYLTPTLVGSDKDNAGTNVAISFKPC